MGNCCMFGNYYWGINVWYKFENGVDMILLRLIFSGVVFIMCIELVKGLGK